MQPKGVGCHMHTLRKRLVYEMREKIMLFHIFVNKCKEYRYIDTWIHTSQSKNNLEGLLISFSKQTKRKNQNMGCHNNISLKFFSRRWINLNLWAVASIWIHAHNHTLGDRVYIVEGSCCLRSHLSIKAIFEELKNIIFNSYNENHSAR
jgi:hypothetical protein